MFNGVFFLIVVFLLLEYGVSEWLSFLNRRSASGELPDRLRGLYDAEAYRRQQAYFRANNRFALVSGSFGLGVILAMLFSGGFGWLYGCIDGLGWGLVATTLLFFGLLYLANDLLSLPFGWYGTFVIEERFGFNQTTRATFVGDVLKSWGLALVAGGLLLGVMAGLYDWLQAGFWIWAFVVAGGFCLLVNLFYSEWIVPLFNRQTPLGPGELRSAIEDFCLRTGFTLDDVFVMDGSRRSSKGNAYFSGLGRRKRIVLYDTLTDRLSTDEIVGVLAHEIGHYRRGHTRMMLIFSLVNLFLLFFIFSLLAKSSLLAVALGADRPAFGLALIAFSLLYTPVGLLTGVVMNGLSRRNEFEADAFAARYGCGDGLVSALKKLSVESLCLLTPHRAYVRAYYSHPTLLQRIEGLDRVMKGGLK